MAGAQVVALMQRFRKGSKNGGEDFQMYRYSPARVVEPDPSNPGETERHTNDMAAIDHRIRPVEDPTKKGSSCFFFYVFQNLICGAPCGDWLAGV